MNDCFPAGGFWRIEVMSRDQSTSAEFDRLREQAEAELRGRPQTNPETAVERLDELVHELQTHQIELEMQNEQLRAAQEELVQSRDNYSDLYDFAPVGYVTLSGKGLILAANLTLADFLGKERQSLVKARFSTFVIGDDQDAYYRYLRALSESGQKQSCELRMHGEGAEPCWVKLDGVRVEAADDEQHRIRLAITDISPQKRVEEALGEANLRFGETVRAGNVGLWDWVLETNKVHYSPEWKAQIGYQEDEIANEFEEWRSRIHPDDLPGTLRAVEEAIAERRDDYIVEFRFRHKDGSWRWIAAKGSVLTDDTGKAERFVGSHVDITDRKEAEDKLAEAKDAAEAANRAKSEFLANMSHEIRTPMTAILGYADLLMAREWSPAERREHLEVIHRNGKNLLTIINDILDLSKIEAEQVELELKECSPAEVVEEVRSLLQIRANDKNLGLDVGYAYPLPRMIRTDPVRLRQILVNLVSNAIKFSEKGGVKIRVAYADRRMRFEIDDTGIGISEKEIARLFQPFTQADTSPTRRFGGTGLGLHISQRLATMLGGQIEVQSQPGVGSTFILTIDTGLLEDVEMETTTTFVKEEKPAKAGRKPRLSGRILLAEDVKEVRTLVRMTLEALGVEVDLAEDGRAAVKQASASRAEGKPYDLILMDMQMPTMNGYEATRHLRQDGWRGPIIALTAHAMSDDRAKCLEAGCDGYISKPMTEEELFGTLARHLS